MAEAYVSLGQALQQQGHASEARAALDQAQALNERKANAQASTFAVSVGNKRFKGGDVTGAIEQYREAIRLAADNPQAHYRLAIALARRGTRAEAQREYEAARSLAPFLQPPPGFR
jgi:superkiller protein 3